MLRSAASLLRTSSTSPALLRCCRRLLSRWSHVQPGAKDPILGVTEAYAADHNPLKLNLGVGAYRCDVGNPVVLRSVHTACQRIVAEDLDHEYAPIHGLDSFIDGALCLAHGGRSELLRERRIAALQSLSGTGALRLIGAFVERFALGAPPAVYVPNPTWGNHAPVFGDAGLAVRQYRYYDAATKSLDEAGMLGDLDAAPDAQLVVLHASAHNPTGVDPKPHQWKKISELCLRKRHLCVFDMAYQGFASGCPEKDAESVRMFVEDGHDVALAQSFSKNFGLYGQRVGCASIVTADADEAVKVQSQMKILARAMYSNPPIHGARIVDIVLGDDQLRQQWLGEVNEMAQRIIAMRVRLRHALQQAGSQLNWQHITEQIGMFCYSGLTAEQVDRLAQEYHIYLTRNGRISMAGLTSDRVEYLAQAMHEVTSS